MKDAISNELTNSLKSGEKDRIHTLRLILAAIKDKEIASRSSGQDAIISDENIIQRVAAFHKNHLQIVAKTTADSSLNSETFNIN